MRLLRVTLMLAGLFRTSAHATILDPVTEQDLVKGAELIFQGEVTSIEHRMSSSVGPNSEVMAHTFVTYRIERVWMGQVSGRTGPGGTVTLRFLGGPNTAKRRWLSVEACPNFDLGDRDILFVRRNGRHICPLVGWQQGRFRIIGGDLYGDGGEEIWMTPAQTIAYGDAHPLPDVLEHHRGPRIRRTVHGGDPAEETQALPPMEGTRLAPSGFQTVLSGLVTTLRTPEDLAQLQPVVSSDPDAPFSVSRARSVRPPPEPVTPRRSRTGLTGLQRAEQVLVERFGPVLKVPKPPRSHGHP